MLHNFTQFLAHYKNEHLNSTTTTIQLTDQETTTLNHQAINCLQLKVAHLNIF